MTSHKSDPRQNGFRLGIYVFKDAEIVDFASPHGVFSVARRLDPELDAFLIADAMRPVQTQAGFTVLPNYSFNDAPDGISEELKEFTWALGAEYWYQDSFALRLGYFNENELKGARKFFTLGAGFKYNVVKIAMCSIVN